MGSQAMVPKTNITDPKTRILLSKRLAKYCRHGGEEGKEERQRMV